jgi:hypothetical protein
MLAAIAVLAAAPRPAAAQTKAPARPAGKAAAPASEPVLDATVRQLLEKLEEREMPDVVIWVLDRVAADPAASAGIKAEIPFRRAGALVALSRNEADAKKRAAQFDSALEQIDAFLATQPTGQQAIDAYTQRGNLLVERGRMRLEQAKRPSADVAALRAQAAESFTQAIKSLEGTAKPGKPIPTVTNAEDAVIKEYRDVRDAIAELKGEEKPADPKAGSKGPPRPVRRAVGGEKQKELQRLEALLEQLKVKLVQTRLMVGSAYFEKAKAFEKGSPEWKTAVQESTKQFKEVADKYSTMGAGLFARYYEGRNHAELDDNKKAVDTLAALATLEAKAPVAVLLRSKALATSLGCWIEDKQFDKLDESARKFVLAPLPKNPDEDWLAMKYRAAVLLDGLAGTLDAKDKAAKGLAQRDAKKLAIEVATANGAFAEEARALASKLGKDVPEGEEEKTFASLVAEARVQVTTFQGKQAEAKKLQSEGKAEEAAAAATQAGAERDRAIAMFNEAIALAGEGGAQDAAVNTARYMLTYLMYDAKRYREAAELGTLLATQFPNAMGSKQASMIAMASWQQLVRQPDAGGGDPKAGLIDLATVVARTWPQEAEGGEAFGILANDAIDSRDAAKIIAAVDAVPAASPKRGSILQRAGAALWREVQQQGRLEAGVGAAPDVVAGWKQKATDWLDEGLKAPPVTGPLFKAHVAAALARAQIALDDGDSKLAISILENTEYGPWTVVTADAGDPTLREGSFAEAALTVALRSFIQGQAIDKAQQSMERLETLAAKGDGDAAQRLTAMYFNMGRELQEQLERLGTGPEASKNAAPILSGFEKFLDGLSKRDPKVASQIWVATTYLTLGSGKGGDSVVPADKAQQYLKRAGEVYGGLLERKGDAEIAKFEPSIRLKMASIARARGEWDEAQKQIDWILADPKRQNSIDTQWQAAELLQLAGRAIGASDPAGAEQRLKEAISGRPLPPGQPVIWGWGVLANKVSRQAFAGNDEKSLKARDQFFEARLNLAACLLDRARLKDKPEEAAKDLATKAKSSIATTRKLHADLGGEASRGRYEKLLKDVQMQLDPGNKKPAGFAELDAEAAAAAGPPVGAK